jgi:hypothetical protein
MQQQHCAHDDITVQRKREAITRNNLKQQFHAICDIHIQWGILDTFTKIKGGSCNNNNQQSKRSTLLYLAV